MPFWPLFTGKAATEKENHLGQLGIKAAVIIFQPIKP